MTEEEDEAIRDILKGQRIFEAHRVIAEYKCFRKGAHGDSQEVIVRVTDLGPENPNGRYCFHVWQPDGTDEPVQLFTNPSDSIYGAGMRVHWRTLDRDTTAASSTPITTMPLSYLTFLIIQLNAALDSGKYDTVGLADVKRAIEEERVIPWLKVNVRDVDVSLFDDEAVAIYHHRLARIFGGYAGDERRKWGVEKRGLCLLIAWTNEIIQQELREHNVRAEH